MKKEKISIFKKIFKDSYFVEIGKCTDSKKIEFFKKNKSFSDNISNFEKSYKKKIKGL